MRHKLTAEERAKGYAAKRAPKPTFTYSDEFRQDAASELRRQIFMAKNEASYAPIYRGRIEDVE